MSVTVSQQKNFVGGAWVDAVEGGTMEVINPATGATIAEVPRGTEADVDRAVEAAKKALPEWLETTPGERAEALLKLADAIDEHADELAELESTIVGGIAPWNYPLMMAVWKFAPSLAAGNVQIMKPSEQTPLTTLRFAELAADILPAGVFNVITGDGEPVGAGIVRHRDVRMVSLTGDVATGKEVARAAAETLKRVHLELGGKAPVLVFDDADPAAVAEGIKVGGYFNAGQDCTAATRVLAGPKIHDAFVSGLADAARPL